MVRLRAILISLIGLAVSGLLGGSYWTKSHVPTSESGELVPIIVTKDYLPAYSVLKPKALEIRQYPKALVPPGAFKDLVELKTESGREAYFTVVGVPPGQILTSAFLIEIGKRHGIASILPPGRVAVSFGVDRMRGVGGWIEPGDTIAVFHSSVILDKGTSLKKSSELLFPALKVLAVDNRRLGATPRATQGQILDSEPSEEAGGHVITVLLNPLEASALIRARDQGQLSIALRAMGDDQAWGL